MFHGVWVDDVVVDVCGDDRGGRMEGVGLVGDGALEHNRVVPE